MTNAPRSSRPLRVLFAAMRWDYGVEARGPSFEWTNFLGSLERMEQVEVAAVDVMSAHLHGGPDAVRHVVIEAVDGFKPDLAFFCLYEDEVPEDLLIDLQSRPDVITYNWFCDDHWRFEDFTRQKAPLFDLVSTTTRSALQKYEAAGIGHVVLTQWACNPHRYTPTPGPDRHGITFVGQSHGERRWILKRSARKGLRFDAWGAGWPNGRLDEDEMIEVFGTSKVNLNLTNASNDPRVPRLVRGVANRTYPPAVRWFGGGLEQIKGRTFEIPACGGFQLSGWADDIEAFFEPDVEIVLFTSPDELIEKAQRYVADDGARRRIAENGYRRTVAEHTYAQRFRAIFEAAG